MPILDAETNLFPSNLLDLPVAIETDSDEAPRWWAFYTRSRQEKSLARELIERNVPFYLPLVPRRLLIRGRGVHSFVPLFTGYVFVFGSNTDRVSALRTNRVAHVLPVKDGEQLRNDLLKVRRLIELNMPLTVEARIVPGSWVRVRSGPMAGMEGRVIRRKRGTRLVVDVTMLQQSVSVEFDDFLLDPIG